MRKSFLLRADPADPNSTSWIKAMARDGRASPRVELEAFLHYLADEVGAIDDAVDGAWDERVSNREGLRTVLSIEAAQLELEAFVSLQRGRKPARVQLGLGTLLALDDLALFACALPVVLAPNQAALRLGDPSLPFTPPESLVLAGARLERPDRFWAYRTGFTGGLDRAALTYVMPLDPWRLRQAVLLSELMLAFVLMHERMHWALGHLDLIRRAGATVLRMSETRQAPPPAQRAAPGRAVIDLATYRAMELQADSNAFMLLCAYAMRDGGACDGYEADADAFQVPRDPRVLRRLGFGNRLRLCLTAAGLVCLAFRAGQMGLEAGPADTHPSPGARLMNLMVNAPLTSPLVAQDDDGDWVLRSADCIGPSGLETPAFRELTHDGMAMALFDLQTVSRALGDQFDGLNPIVAAGDGWRAASWMKDLRAFWQSDAETDHSPARSAAALELLALKSVDAALPKQLYGLQRRRFGGEMSVELGDIMPASRR